MTASASTSETLSADAKAAARVFLQRAEVRLSTLHRIAGAFLAGAGLLLLFPAMLRDAMVVISKAFLEPAIDHIQNQNTWAIANDVLMALSLLLVIGLPVYAIYAILEDLVRFYFTPNMPGMRREPFLPLFSVPASVFSKADDDTFWRIVRTKQDKPDNQTLVLPYKQVDRDYYLNLRGLLIKSPDNQSPDYGVYVVDDLSKHAMLTESHLYVALNLAGARDRSIVEEVSLMELLLIRQTVILRRLVLRYIKALLIFIWTAGVVLCMSSLAEIVSSDRGAVLVARASGWLDSDVYLWLLLILWATFIAAIVRVPIKWIIDMANPSVDKRGFQHDAALVRFERRVLTASFFVLCSAASLHVVLLMVGVGRMPQHVAVLISSIIGIAVYWYSNRSIGPLK